MSINPIKLTGNWVDGYALDKHTISSEYIGEDAFGNKQFDNKYTKLGELLYKFKYNGHHDTSLEILEIAKPFLDEFVKNKSIDIIIPVPPTNKRDIQPIHIIAELFSDYLKIPYSTEILANNSDKSSKDGNKQIKIDLLKNAKRKCNILLLDDLFSTGATLNECAKVLKTDELVENIYVITLTKTRD